MYKRSFDSALMEYNTPLNFGQWENNMLFTDNYETFFLDQAGSVKVPKLCTSFTAWDGPLEIDNYGGKTFLDWRGEPVFGELAILRLLEDNGYEGAWIDTYRSRTRISIDEVIELPDVARDVLESIYRDAGHRYGAFDVIAWKSGEFVFAEGKRRGKDRIRDTQLQWLDAALRQGHPLQSFLIVEWDTR